MCVTKRGQESSLTRAHARMYVRGLVISNYTYVLRVCI